MTPPFNTISHTDFQIAWAPIDSLCKNQPATGTANNRILEQQSAKILVRHIFGDHVLIEHLPSGKPFLVASDPTVKLPLVSITHGAGIIAIAFTNSLPTIGIDLEAPRKQLLNIYQRFLRPEEYPQSLSIIALQKLWTQKEAAWKALISPPPSLLNVNLSDFKFFSFPLIHSALLTVAILA